MYDGASAESEEATTIDRKKRKIVKVSKFRNEERVLIWDEKSADM